MGPAKSAFRPRPGGGFNQGIGHFNEHLDEQSMQSASQQKALTQQVADPRTAQAVAQGQNQAQSGIPSAPREVGSLADELIKRPARDIWNEVKQFFSLNTWLGIKPAEDPEKRAKQKQIHQRYSQLTQEQQAEARKRYERELQKKQAQQQEEEQRKQAEAQQNAQTVEVPSSSQKGPQGPAGSKKQKAVTKLQNDRKQLGGPSSAN